MKKIIVICLLLFIILGILPQFAHSQSVYTIKVIDDYGKPLNNIKVWLLSSSGEKIEKITQNGMVEFSISSGYYTVNLPGLLAHKEIDIPEGAIGSGSYTIYYNINQLNYETQFITKRALTTFSYTDVTGKKVPAYSDVNCIVAIRLINTSGLPLAQLPVNLVDVKNGIIYTNKTDASGKAAFEVPINNIYGFDIDGIKNQVFTHLIANESHVTLEQQYEPLTITEKTVDNYTVQDITSETKATSSNALVIITINNAKQSEKVYVQQIGSTKTYMSETDENNQTRFLLPKGEKYMINFEYQKDVDCINLTKTHGISTLWYNLTYVPQTRLQFPEQYLPDIHNFFLKEFSSFITKQWPNPDKQKAKIYYKWGNYLINGTSKEAVLQIGIVINENTDNPYQRNNDIVYVLDNSGSMAGYNRIESLKFTMEKMIDQILPTDNLSIITFNDKPTLEYKLNKINKKEDLKQIITLIEPGGGTVINDALLLGFEQLEKNKNPNHSQHMLLLSDGYGSDDPEIILKTADKFVANNYKISAIGLGTDYNYALLELLTQKGNGMLSSANQSEQLTNAFEEQWKRIFSPAGNKAVLSVKTNPKITLTNMYNYTHSVQNQYNTEYNLGEVNRGQTIHAIALFQLDKPDKTIENTPVVLTFSYTEYGTNNQVVITENCFLKWEESTGEYQLILEAEQKKLYAIAFMNQALKNMVESIANNDYPKAKHQLQLAVTKLSNLYPNAKDTDVDALYQSINQYINTLEQYMIKYMIKDYYK